MPLALAGALRFSEDVLGMSYYSALAFTRASVALLSGMLPISAYLYLREMLAPAAMSSSTSVTSSLGGSSGVDGAFEWREIACLLGAALCAFHDAVLGRLLRCRRAADARCTYGERSSASVLWPQRSLPAGGRATASHSAQLDALWPLQRKLEEASAAAAATSRGQQARCRKISPRKALRTPP